MWWSGRNPIPRVTAGFGQPERSAPIVRRDDGMACETRHLAPHRCTTTTGAFGTCARMPGEYIASTRVGGRLKRPAPFSRTA